MERFRDGDLLRFKMKFCNFCEAACGRGDAFGLRSDDFVRNNLLNVIVEWFEPEVCLLRLTIPCSADWLYSRELVMMTSN